MEQQHTNPEDDYSFFFDFDFELSLWDKVMVVALLCVVIVASPILIPMNLFRKKDSIDL